MTKIITEFPRKIREIENTIITLPDGCELAARIWLPENAESNPVPAILEYLPYRKREGTAVRDALTHPYFAGHGYASVRVDMRGNGDSEGLMHDEYLQQELDDGVAVINWLAQQNWCTGKVGMMGISWGGFNGLQVAALRPEPLKSIITLCSTDDRYTDDIHFKGGALLMENLGWAGTMFSYSSRPPDPLLSTERWREMWLQRLENTPLLVDNWLQHQHRDEFWKHGSICEDYSDIEAAVLAVGGWYDAYSNAIPRMMENLDCPRKGIIGPWAHKYPHFAVPEPRIGFLQEALRWWDRWLKDIDTSVEDDPLYRVYVMDSTRPNTSQAVSKGRWITMDKWPDSDTHTANYFFNDTKLVNTQSSNQSWLIDSPQDTGTGCGEFCIMWLGADWPDDQRPEDANSLTFDTGLLENDLTIVGAPVIELELSSDTPQANVAVRLCDVWPDGASTRISFGILNLCHRDSHEHPEPLTPGERYRVRVQLDDIAYRIVAGHKLRISISNAYWPMIWPSPEKGSLTLHGDGSHLEIPVRNSQSYEEVSFPPVESATPLRQETLRKSSNQRTVTHDLVSGTTTVSIVDDFGKNKILEHGLVNSEIARETYSINSNDPLSCRATMHWTEEFERDQWNVRTETKAEMWSDKDNFYIKAHMQAFEGSKEMFNREWVRTVARKLV